MKKLLSGKFLLILATSIIVLIMLILGAFYLFDDSDDYFVKSGYVLNPLSEKQEKYFFDKGTSYKSNLQQMIEFNDVDKVEVSILKDSFLHYMDESLSFLKKGAILDLNTVSNKNTVSFYNITSKSIIEKSGAGYVIKSANGEIKLNNFIGRINDNKYIVVGKINAKIPGNDKQIEGSYFEVVYTEEGIINIENKDVKYQVMAEGTEMSIGNIKIEFGDKVIKVNNDNIMSLTEITIDGDENIEIVPKAEEPEEEPKENPQGGGTGADGGIGTGENNTNSTGTDNGQGAGTGTGEGSGGTIVNVEKTEDTIVTLKEGTVGSTSISLVFDIINPKENDDFVLKVMNVDTGRTVDITSSVIADARINVNLLSPNTRYLVSVINNRDEGRYFQKIFTTRDFGISLERMYVSDSKLAYKVKVDENTDIVNAKLSLYKFNEETMQNEIVKTPYIEDGETKYNEKVMWLTNINQDNGEIVFDGLDSNTIYTAVLDEFSVASSNFKDIYNITLTSLTLKKTPIFGEMKADKDLAKARFKLSFDDVQDEDGAITNYTYLIYEEDNDDNTAISPIKKNNASGIEVKIGDSEGQLKSDTNYYYQVIVEYFDNEKYIEYMLSDKINFVMGSDPLITVVPNEELISYNSIGATILLTDTSCLIGMPNRQKCPTENSSTIVTVKKNSVVGESIVYSEIVDFDILDDEIKYELYVNNLEEGALYSIEVSAIRKDNSRREELNHSDASQRTIKTKTLSSFIAIYPEEDKLTSSANHVVNQRIKLEASTNNTGTLTPEESAKAIKKVVISLYEGNGIEGKNPITAPRVFNNNSTTNIKEMFYDNYYQITTDETFGLDIDELKALSSDGRLSPTYTIRFRAYYDTDEINEVRVENNILTYTILESLLLENVEDPILLVKPIKHSESGKIFDRLKDNGTIVGYSVNAVYDRPGLVANKLNPQNINIYVYNTNKEKVKFYVKNNNTLRLVDKITTSIADLQVGNYLTEIFMDYALEYGQTDNIMRRGNAYYIGYEIDVSTENGNIKYPSNVSEDSPSDYGIYELQEPSLKETPNVKTYISSSTSTSITYKYEIVDVDNALYREDTNQEYGLYYSINDSEEKKLNITKTEDYTYKGEVTLTGLKKNDGYKVYYKKHVFNSGDITKDVVNYLENGEEGNILFEGYYNALEESNGINIYNFKYEIINNPLIDNKVTFKIHSNKELLDRTFSYKIHFTDSKGNTLDKEIWKLDECSDGDIRCFSVDYIDLKNVGMKSNIDEENLIRVTIEAIYDNGLTGFDLVKENEEYMIFQNYSTPAEKGKYLAYKSDGKLSLWDEELNIGIGYYTYSLNNPNRTSIYYKSIFNSNHKANISNITLSTTGYNSSFGIINPKKVVKNTMLCDNNTFTFSSITPKVRVNSGAGLIDGSIQSLTLSGVDLIDIKNESTDPSKKEYYLYIDIWNDRDKAINKDSDIIRPTVKVKISNNNPNITYQVVIDKLRSLPNNEYYYYNVYAYMNKNGNYELTQLFDEKSTGDQTKTYQFTTRNGNSLYTDREITYEMDEEIYGNRLLNTKINLSSYQNYPYNFDLMYMICYDDTCTKEDGYIFKKTIPMEEVTNNIVSKEDISAYDLEFDKEYKIYIYAVNKMYVKNEGIFSLEDQYVNIISSRDITFKLTKLRTPNFIIERKAGNEDNKYFIDFKINVNDPDKTLIDGKYYIKLTNSSGDVVGTLQVLDEDNNYISIDNYDTFEFDASELNKQIRITDLEENSKYSIMVSSEAYINNYSEEIPKEERTIEITKSHTIYTTDVYGITFGKDKDISYQVNDNSYIILFRNATNFDNVLKVNYSVSLDDEFNPGIITSGEDVIGEDHKFEFNWESGYGMYIINRNDGIKNEEGKYYLITLSFEVKDPNDPDNTIILTAAENPRFTESVIYIKEIDNK